MQWISSEIKLRRSHHTGRTPKPYAGAYYIIRTNKGKGNINQNPDTDWILRLRRLAKPTQGMSYHYTHQLYLSVALPKMTYAADIWFTPIQHSDQRDRKSVV